MKPGLLDDAIASLCAQAALPPPLSRSPIRIWELSGVERVVLTNGRRVICKYATRPFTTESIALQVAGRSGVPVPSVHASLIVDEWLLMLLEDLGEPTRKASDLDGSLAAAWLHRAGPDCPDLPVWDSAALAALPDAIVAMLTGRRAAAEVDLGSEPMQALAGLSRNAKRRAAGAQTPPFGMVHGELHPTSVHIGHKGTNLLDFGMAFIGPEILDLATWQGTRHPPNRKRLTDQFEAYIAAGGTEHISTPRGGVPAAAWALGWHRLYSAAWLLTLTADGAGGFGTKTIEQILRRQIITSADLLR